MVKFSPLGSSDRTILLWDTRFVPTQIASDQIPVPTRQVATAQTPQQIAKSALAATVLIVMEDASGQTLSTGSGFFVDPRYNCHQSTRH